MSPQKFQEIRAYQVSEFTVIDDPNKEKKLYLMLFHVLFKLNIFSYELQILQLLI
jgi:hypothetical protein